MTIAAPVVLALIGGLVLSLFQHLGVGGTVPARSFIVFSAVYAALIYIALSGPISIG